MNICKTRRKVSLYIIYIETVLRRRIENVIYNRINIAEMAVMRHSRITFEASGQGDLGGQGH